MNIKSVLSAAAVASLLIAPVAAQAGTVASKSTLSKKSLSAAGQRRAKRVKSDENLAAGMVLPVALIGTAAVVGGVIVATDDNKSSGS
jgi:hypothetical protein